MIILLLCAAQGDAASTFIVSSSGGGVFTLQGQGIEGASAMDITLKYDPAALGNPRVEQGALVAGAMTAVNATVPGTVRIALIRIAPITGSGTIATIVFERRDSTADPVKELLVRLTDVNGRPLLSQAGIAGSTLAAAPESQQSSQTAAAQTAPTAVSPSMPASSPLVVPGVVVKAPEGDTQHQGTAPSAGKEPAAKGSEPTAPAAEIALRKDTRRDGEPASKGKGVFTQKSVLDLFREHRGQRTPNALIGLFGQEPLIGCRQDPSPVLSDGTATARVTFVAPSGAKGAPEVALMGASLVSLSRDSDNTNTWVAVVRPHRDAIEVKMTVPLDDVVMVIPLTVAPKRDLGPKRAGKPGIREFEEYLKGKGAASGRDLNGDGQRNYLDDYIFTANYIAGMMAPGGAVRK